MKVDVHIDGNVLYSDGMALTSTIIGCGVYFCAIFICLFLNIRKAITKKFTPLYIFILFFILVIVLNQIDQSIVIISAVLAFVNLIMLFTVENPDLKMIEQLNIAKAQAEKANNSKTEFLSNMSHEIRTPLNAVIGFSQSLLEEDMKESQKEQVKDILSASNSLLDLVNGILDISKIEANKLEIINTEYSIHEVLNNLVSLTRARLGEKPLDFRINFDPNLPPVLYGDYTRLKQIILNLLTNAVKYTKEGYIEFKVNTVQKDDICRLIISVEDSGIGIKNENIDKLFTKFERFDLEKNITIEGTGLGLAITKKLVELMNGKIVVQSVYGKGSRFTVAIDQRIIDKPLEIKETVEQEILDLTGTKILVVDDNKMNLKVASKLLEKYKCEVITCESGFECLEKIKTESYDLILMDDMMPKMSGTETLKKLKEIDNFHTKVIALTANAISGMKEKYIESGFHDYLSKPIDKEELYKILYHYGKKEKLEEPKTIEPKIEQPNIPEQIEDLDLTNKKILIVDDNKLNIKVATNLIKKYHPEIDFVLSGQECIDKIKNNEHYDLIFMDDMMPELSGTETFLKLKEDPNFQIPVCMLTANAIEGMREKYLSIGFNDYLSKPIKKEELIRVLTTFLQ